jgi:hypothetical protein
MAPTLTPGAREQLAGPLTSSGRCSLPVVVIASRAAPIVETQAAPLVELARAGDQGAFAVLMAPLLPPGFGLGDVIPLTSGAAMFIQDTGSPYDTYFLESDGTLQALPAAGGDGAAPS